MDVLHTGERLHFLMVFDHILIVSDVKGLDQIKGI